MLRTLLLILLVLLTGCSQPDRQGEIRFALARAPINLDPRFATDATSERINRLIYQRLVEFDEQSRLVPGIADWQKLSPMHYRFQIKPGLLFHNGVKLTASDVLATYESILDSSTISPHKGLLARIKYIQQIDEATIDFHLSANDNLFPGRLTIGILPADLIRAKHNFHAMPVGSGGFALVGHNDQHDILLKRLGDEQHFRFIEVRDPTVRLMKLLKGEIDMLQNDIPPELYAWLSKQEEITTVKRNGHNYTYLGLNLQSDKLRDVRVRKAIAHAIDREALLRYMLHNRAKLAESVLSNAHWAGHKQLKAHQYNPKLAKQLLNEAGFNEEKRLELVYKTSTDPLRIRIATIIVQQLAKVGVSVRLQSLDWGTFYGDIKSGNFELYSLSWVGIRSPDIFEYIFHSKSFPPVGANRGRYSNKSVDKLINAALYEDTSANMYSHLLDVQEYIHKELPYVPLWYEDQFYAARKDITGYSLKADGNFDGLAMTDRISQGKSL